MQSQLMPFGFQMLLTFTKTLVLCSAILAAVPIMAEGDFAPNLVYRHGLTVASNMGGVRIKKVSDIPLTLDVGNQIWYLDGRYGFEDANDFDIKAQQAAKTNRGVVAVVIERDMWGKDRAATFLVMPGYVQVMVPSNELGETSADKNTTNVQQEIALPQLSGNQFWLALLTAADRHLKARLEEEANAFKFREGGVPGDILSKVFGEYRELLSHVSIDEATETGTRLKLLLSGLQSLQNLGYEASVREIQQKETLPAGSFDKSIEEIRRRHNDLLISVDILSQLQVAGKKLEDFPIPPVTSDASFSFTLPQKFPKRSGENSLVETAATIFLCVAVVDILNQSINNRASINGNNEKCQTCDGGGIAYQEYYDDCLACFGAGCMSCETAGLIRTNFNQPIGTVASYRWGDCKKCGADGWR